MNPQEPPSHIQIATSGQPQEQIAQDASAMVDSTVIVTLIAQEQEKEQTRQKDPLSLQHKDKVHPLRSQ